jgi:hypothetical protein
MHDFEKKIILIVLKKFKMVGSKLIMKQINGVFPFFSLLFPVPFVIK